MDDRTSQEATPPRAAVTSAASPSFDPRDLIPTPIFCASPEGRLAWMNAAAESLTGRHAAAVAGEPFSCLFPDEWKLKAARAILRERRRGRTEFYIEAPIVTGGVDARWVGLHVRLATAANGRTAYVCAAHDLHEIHTELDVLKRRTREMAARLEEATAGAELKSNFLASMSGELRAPMNGVIGMSRLLLDSNLDRDQRTWTEVIQGSGQQLLELVDDILDYSRIESGQLAIGSMDFDLRVTVDAVASLLSAQAHDSNVHFSSLVHHRVPSLVNGDPGRVRQVLLQLAQCALDQAEGGEVQLRVELVEETAHQAVLRFWVNRIGGALGGDAEAEAGLLAVYGGTSAPGSRFGGRALGLTIAHRLVSLMGGDSGATSIPDMGSKLWFRIPLGKQADRPATAPRAAERGDVTRLRALVVDGDAFARGSIRETIAAWGATCDEARGGLEAIEAMKSAVVSGSPYGAVIVDLEVAELDAATFARTVRDDAMLAATPLALVTGMGRPGDAARAEDWGYGAYFVKPLESAELRAALTELIAREPGSSARLVTRHTVAELKKSRVRVVVVEDNPIDQLVIASALRRVGYAPEMVGDVEAAAVTLAAQAADVVFVDVASAGEEGIERARALRASCDASGGRRTPIVALVGRVREEDRTRCAEAGIDDLLGKPVDLEALVATVGRWADATPPSEAEVEAPAVEVAEEPIVEVAAVEVAEEPVVEVAVEVVEEPVIEVVVDIVEEPVIDLVTEPFAEVEAPLAETEAPVAPVNAWDAGEIAVLDATCLDAVSMGNSEIRGLMLDAFLTRSRQPLERLKKAAEWKDVRAVEFQAHALSGMCRSVGAVRTEWVLDRIAEYAVGGRMDEVDAGIAAVDAELEAVRAEWKRGAAPAVEPASDSSRDEGELRAA
jgi:PAS domain S-box-containing protein